MNKKGFTLIELLAVIIILGILMIIAIPSVTSYINDSRKNVYVDTAKEVIGSARNLVNSGVLEMYDTDATYYIDVNCIKTENAMKSPYGEFVNDGAYVVVTYNGEGYDYYWTSVDDTGQGIRDIVKSDRLDVNNIKSDLSIEDIKTNRTIDGRSKVVLITERNGCKKEGAITENLIQVSSSGESIVFPTGKTKDTVVVGDIVTIGTEEFYVVKHDGNKLILLSKYNLKVGNIYDSSFTKTGEYTSSDPGYVRQSSEAKGYVEGAAYFNGTLSFSNTNYWNEKVGDGLDYPGNYCKYNTYTPGTICTYVYDSNSNLKTYVDKYKAYLESLGATIKEARLLKAEEAFELGCGNGTNDCSDASSFVSETSFWLGSAGKIDYVRSINYHGNFTNTLYSLDKFFGVRPVIVI